MKIKNTEEIQFVPACFSLVNGIICCCNRVDAEYLLYDIKIGKYYNTINDHYMLRIGPAVIKVKAIRFNKIGITAFYIHIDEHLPNLIDIAKIGLARIQFGYDICNFNLHTSETILLSAMNIQNISSISKIIDDNKNRYGKIISDVLTGNKIIPVNKISAKHLRHITIDDLRTLVTDMYKSDDGSLGYKKVEILYCMGYILENSEDIYESAFITILLWLYNLDEKLLLLVLNSQILKKKSIDTFAKENKQLSLKFKNLQNVVNMDLSQLYELDVLINRGFGEVDWSQEKKERTTYNEISTHNRDEIFIESVRFFRAAIDLGAKPNKMDWKKFWGNRFEMCPTGAFHSQYDEDKEYIPKERTLRNKFYIANKMPDFDIDHYLNRKPEILAWQSTKYEWAKVRAIFGVDFTSFIITTFAFLGCEKCVPHNCPIGDNVNVENMNNLIESTLLGAVPYCTDYKNFNVHHSIESMQMVLLAYKQVYLLYLTEDQIRSIDWVVASLSEMYVMEKDGGKEKDYRTVGTLFSGWRLTSFMNTVLNYVYCKIAKGRTLVMSLHNGDDALMGVHNLREVLIIEKNLIKKNVKLQLSKCFIGGIAEFLRQDRTNKKNTQYLTRSISTLVHGQTESLIPNNVGAIFEAINERTSECIGRGANKKIIMSIKKIMLDKIIKNWRLGWLDFNDYENTHRAFGGLSMDPNARYSNEYRLKRIYISDKDEKSGRETFFPGAYSYAVHICDYLLDISYIPKAYNRIVDAIISNSGENRWTLEIDNNELKNIRWPTIVIDKYKYLRQDVSYNKARIARMFGLPLVGLNTKSSHIYHELMSYDNMLYWAGKFL